jgi:hypothetical protein
MIDINVLEQFLHMLKFDLSIMYDFNQMLLEKILYGDQYIVFLMQIEILMFGKVVLGIVTCRTLGMGIVV